MMRIRGGVVLLASSIVLVPTAALSACVGDSSNPVIIADGGGTDATSGTDGTTTTDGSTATDAGPSGTDASSPTDAGTDATPLPFNPSQLPGLALWLEGDKAAVDGGTAVTTWPDSSPNHNDATPGGPTLAPSLVKAALNGHSVVRFDGTSMYMTIADSASLGFGANGTNPFVLEAVVTYPVATNGSQAIFAKFGASTIGPQLQAYHDTNGTSFSAQVDTEVAAFGKAIVPTGSFRVMLQWTPNATPPGGTMSVRAGGSPADTKAVANATTLASSAPAYVGAADYGGPMLFFPGDIAEIVLFSPPGTINAADIASLETYLNKKYGL
jgi:hypothetical protein